MKNLAQKNTYAQPSLDYGFVASETDGVYSLDTSMGMVRAKRAAGCLISPSIGDEVLLSFDPAGRVYILSVLEQAPENMASTDLEFDRSVNLIVRKGDLTVRAQAGVHLIGDEKLDLVSDEIQMSAKRGRVVINQLTLIGGAVSSQVKRISSVAVSVEQTFKRLTQRLDNAFRYIKEHDEVQAGSARHLVEDSLTMQSKNTDLTSEEVVRVTAEQIHLN